MKEEKRRKNTLGPFYFRVEAWGGRSKTLYAKLSGAYGLNKARLEPSTWIPPQGLINIQAQAGRRERTLVN